MNSILKDKSKLKIINGCTLFGGLDSRELENALDFFGATVKEYKKGDFLQTILSPFEHFGLVLSGEVRVYMDDIDGDNMIMANVSAGETFGESLCLLKAESPVYIEAVTDAEILSMSTARFHSPSEDAAVKNKYLLRFSSMLARRTLTMNSRIQVLSNITLREKIVTFLSQYCAQLSSHDFYIPFDRSSMAVYLGTDRASLSRELSKMKRDGIIDFNKNHFIIKN